MYKVNCFIYSTKSYIFQSIGINIVCYIKCHLPVQNILILPGLRSKYQSPATLTYLIYTDYEPDKIPFLLIFI